MNWDKWEEEKYQEYIDEFHEGEDFDDSEWPKFETWLAKEAAKDPRRFEISNVEDYR